MEIDKFIEIKKEFLKDQLNGKKYYEEGSLFIPKSYADKKGWTGGSCIVLCAGNNKAEDNISKLNPFSDEEKDKDLAIEMQFEDNSFRDIKPLIGQECIRAYVNPVTDGMDIYANWRICGLACEFKADEVKNTISFVIRYNSAELIQMWPNGNVGEKIAIKILDL